MFFVRGTAGMSLVIMNFSVIFFVAMTVTQADDSSFTAKNYCKQNETCCRDWDRTSYTIGL